MVDVTRRRALGLAGGALGLGACATNGVTETEVAAPAVDYAGEVAFEHGVASGDPLPDSVILWTRVTPASDAEGPIPVQWQVRDGDEAVASGVAMTSAARDFTVKVDADGLTPGTSYTYHFWVTTPAGEIASPEGRTRTAKPAGSDDKVRFAFISCSNYPFGRFHAYREIANQDDLDAIIHLGDYFYEYGIDGYGAEVGEALGRTHDPITETVTLADYRTRHAQYKTDPDLQAAHAAAPWLCTWDDHESTNNSYRTGAENHNPEENEGDWTTRKQVAVQAYLEWMPVRDPAPGRAQEAIYRRFDFGDVASVFCLESRLTGRSDEISWFTELADKEPAEVPMATMTTMAKVQADSRTMLGQRQEAWLSEGITDSAAKDMSWQVLANQVVMARVRPPNFTQTLSEKQISDLDHTFIQLLIPFSQMGMPLNLDAWDGFPAARDRLYQAARAADARLVTLTGDTHTAWANTLVDMDGKQRGVEFGCTSVTSPGLGTFFPGVDDLGQQFVDANPEVDWYDPHGNGFTLVTFTKEAVRADFVKVSDVTRPDYTAKTVASFKSKRDGSGMTPLEKL